MRRRDPLLALVLGPLATDPPRAVTEGAILADLGRVGVGDHQHGVRGTRPRYARPARFGPTIGTAIDDDPLPLVADLKRQGAGVRSLVEAAWWRPAGVDDHQAATRLQSIKAGMNGVRGSRALCF